MSEIPKNAELTRNSPIRAATSGVRRNIAETIYYRTPIRANGLSIIAAGGNILGSGIAARNQEAILENRENAIKPLGLMALAIADFLDGEVARVEDLDRPGQRNQTLGMLIDVESDSVQERAAGEFRERAARERGDRIGEIAARAAKRTTNLPRITRAIAETLGHPVPENGHGISGLLGTRTGRSGLNILALVFPEHQAKIDAVVAITSGITTARRVKSIVDNRHVPPVLSPEVRKEAAVRAGTLIATEIIFNAAEKVASKKK